MTTNSLNIDILAVATDFEYTYTFLKRTPCGLSNKLIRTLVLLQFEGPQMIARMVLGSIAPCLRFSTSFPIVRNLLSQFITRIVNGCRTHFFIEGVGSSAIYMRAKPRIT